MPWQIIGTSAGVMGLGRNKKTCAGTFFGRYIEDLNVGIVHQNLPYDTMHKLLAFH
jgi:hypothetical protein